MVTLVCSLHNAYATLYRTHDSFKRFRIEECDLCFQSLFTFININSPNRPHENCRSRIHWLIANAFDSNHSPPKLSNHQRNAGSFISYSIFFFCLCVWHFINKTNFELDSYYHYRRVRGRRYTTHFHTENKPQNRNKSYPFYEKSCTVFAHCICCCTHRKWNLKKMVPK